MHNGNSSPRSVIMKGDAGLKKKQNPSVKRSHEGGNALHSVLASTQMIESLLTGEGNTKKIDPLVPMKTTATNNSQLTNPDILSMMDQILDDFDDTDSDSDYSDDDNDCSIDLMEYDGKDEGSSTSAYHSLTFGDDSLPFFDCNDENDSDSDDSSSSDDSSCCTSDDDEKLDVATTVTEATTCSTVSMPETKSVRFVEEWENDVFEIPHIAEYTPSEIRSMYMSRHEVHQIRNEFQKQVHQYDIDQRSGGGRLANRRQRRSFTTSSSTRRSFTGHIASVKYEESNTTRGLERHTMTYNHKLRQSLEMLYSSVLKVQSFKYGNQQRFNNAALTGGGAEGAAFCPIMDVDGTIADLCMNITQDYAVEAQRIAILDEQEVRAINHPLLNNPMMY